MKLVQVEAKTIFGLREVTNNENEMNPTKGKISSLVHRFDANIHVNYRAGARVYSVYSDYESDVSGNYSVLVGADAIESSRLELDSVNIQAGEYLMFAAQGPVPQIVIETWTKIWAYFAQTDCAYQRAYTTDFEFYKSQTEIEIYIAVKQSR